MRNELSLSAFLAAALAAGSATATPITVGKANLVIDVEFWGRQRILTPDPRGTGEDILTYGDPVNGRFRIFPGDATTTTRPSTFPTDPNALTYGRASYSIGQGSPTSFVTSGRVTPFPGSVADDFVSIGDGLTFGLGEPVRDWFQVSDAFSDLDADGRGPRNFFSLSVTTPLDIIQGVGLEQEFDLLNPEENGGTGGGLLQNTANGVFRGLSFIVDRLRVKKQLVCRP